MLQETPLDVPGRIHADAVEAVHVDVLADPLHEARPHPRVLVVVVREAVQLATLEEGGALVVVLVVHQAAVFVVEELRLVEGLQDRDRLRIGGVDGRVAGVVQVHVDECLHLPLVKEHDELPEVGLGAVLRIHRCEVLGPIPVVAMGHLRHDGRHDDAVHAQVLEVAQLGPDARDVAAAIVVELLALGLVCGREAVDQDLVHGHLRPGPGAPRQLVPGRGGGVHRELQARGHRPRAKNLVRHLRRRLVLVARLARAEELRVAVDLLAAAVVPAPLAGVDADGCAALLVGLHDAVVRLHVEELPDEHRVELVRLVAEGRAAHLHVGRLARPRARVQHVVAGGLPADVVEHASSHAGVPLAVEVLQLHPVGLHLAVAREEGLLRHREVVLLVAQHVHDVLQALL
mmetsp:Transcript_66099/g.173272  ORF Transcript_66099/g.173272 Transcript_66099/m.173272 type:complete len:402 (+) Transcript_66099:2101-3306(+)